MSKKRQTTYRVRPVKWVWKHAHSAAWGCKTYTCNGYEVFPEGVAGDNRQWVVVGPGNSQEFFDTLAEAKEAAQEQYEEAVAEAIESYFEPVA